MKYRGRTEILGNILDAANGEDNQDKNYVQNFTKLWAIKGIPFCFGRKQSNRIS